MARAGLDRTAVIEAAAALADREGLPALTLARLAAELGVDAHRLQTLMDARLRQHLAERNDVRVAVA